MPKEFFMAEGDGLPRGVVENMSGHVKQIIELYAKDVSTSDYVIEGYV
jgi:hypothetical protein